jgi:Zn-finger nucleic acid-binding protein
MERMCSNCHAVVKLEAEMDWCPACGGALMERVGSAEIGRQSGPAAEVDHRGIVLPRRHALGGIITPQ